MLSRKSKILMWSLLILFLGIDIIIYYLLFEIKQKSSNISNHDKRIFFQSIVNRKNSEVLRYGSISPDWIAVDLNGKKWQKNNFINNLLFIQFISSHNINEIKNFLYYLEHLQKKYQSKGLKILIIANGDKWALLRQLSEHPLRLTIIFDDEKELSKKFGVVSENYWTFVVKKGRIQFSYKLVNQVMSRQIIKTNIN